MAALLTKEEDEHGEGSQLQGAGLWKSLQFGPHLLNNIQHLILHLHADSQMQVPRGDMKQAFLVLTLLHLKETKVSVLERRSESKNEEVVIFISSSTLQL